MTSLSRITAAAVLVWLGFLFYASTVLVRIHNQSKRSAIVVLPILIIVQTLFPLTVGNVAPDPASDDSLMERLSKALQDVEELKIQNEKLKLWVDDKEQT